MSETYSLIRFLRNHPRIGRVGPYEGHASEPASDFQRR